MSARPLTGAWTHDALQADLAAARRAVGEIVAEKVGLGSWGGDAELDVATLKPSWTTPSPTAYEVKISRADFLADTRAGKYEKYLPYLRRLYFAVPTGLVDKAETPDSMGLIVRGANGWRVVRAPRVLQPDPTKWPVFLQAVLMKHYPGPWAYRDRTRRERITQAEQGADLKARGLRLSARVRNLIDQAEDIVFRDESQRKYLAELAGVAADGRKASDLIHLVLERRPYRDPPDAGRLLATVNRISRDLDHLRALAQEQDGAA